MTTSEKVATDAAKQLRSKKSTKKEKEVAGSDLVQRKPAVKKPVAKKSAAKKRK